MRRNQVLIYAMVGVVVFYAAAAIALGTAPDATDSGAAVVRWFRENKDHVRLAVWFNTFAMVFFGVYAAHVRRFLPAPHRDVFFAGAVTLIAESVLQGWFLAGLALHPGSLQPSNARLALDIASFWGPVLISATILMIAPIVVLAFRGEAGLPRWLGWVAGIALAEQIVESVTIFGTRGFTAPGGPMNLELGAALTLIALLAVGVVVATGPTPSQPATRPT
jgi:hypothetical protein